MAEDKAAPQLDAPKQIPQETVDDLEKGPPAKSYSQDDLDRITAKVRKNARRDAELEFRRQVVPPKDDTPAPPKVDEAPKRDDFETHEEFQRADTEFVARKVAREERTKADTEAKERTAAEQQTKAKQAWHGKIEAAKSKHPDFETVLEDNEQVMDAVYRAPMRAAITESDIGPEIVRHLCLHHEEVTRIAALPGYKQAAAIAKIEDEITAAAKPKQGDEEEVPQDETPEEKEARERNADGTFKAPKKETPKKDLDEPIEPVGGRGAGARSSEPSDKDTPDEWRRKEYLRLKRLREGK